MSSSTTPPPSASSTSPATSPDAPTSLPASRWWALATMIALAVGLHSLGAGLAVGAPLSAGAVSLGTPLVVGVIIQNLIGGIGIVAPIVGDRPSLRTLGLLGLLGGGPAVLGALAGGLFAAQPLTVLLLAIGVGAVAYAAYELWRRVIPAEPATRQAPIMVFAGVLLGMVFLYGVGLVIA
jgi:zinc transporter, ZIP family